MNNYESLCLWLMGKIIIVIGGLGFVISLLADSLMRDMPITLGVMQLVGIIASISICLFGVWADRFLNHIVRDLINLHLKG